VSEQSCIFCAIVAGRAPASFVCRDEVCSAFLDIQPVNPGHVLVIPNRHASYLSDLDPEQGAHMFRVGQKVARALRNGGVRCEGVNIFLADGEAAMQEVFHVHLHVFPRFRGDGFGLKLPPGYFQKTDRSTLEETARIIRLAIDA
jgi:histidine triad (HIT) family protein